MKHSLVIWDYNGTILDDLALSISSVNTLLARRSLPTIKSVEEYHGIFCFPIRDYYKKAGFDFSLSPYEELAEEWMIEYNKGSAALKAHDGVRETIDAIASLGIKQIVLSSCEKEMLTTGLTALGLIDKFDTVLGMDNIYADGKIGMAKRWAGGKLDSAVMIGDTDHDYETAKALGADAVLFSGGCCSHETLAKCGAPVVDYIPDILKFI